MDVKELSAKEQFKKNPQDEKKAKAPRPISNLTANHINTEAVQIEIKSGSAKKHNSTRDKINSVIEQVNLAVKTTEDIASVFESITGIVEQAVSKVGSSDRLKVLEVEARSLAGEVERLTSMGKGFTGEAFESDKDLEEIELRLKQTIESLVNQKPFGPSDIKFSNIAEINTTVTKVSSAKERLENITKTIKETSLEIKKALEMGEIASANSEASSVLVRDVEQALEVAKQTSLSINTDPVKAIAAVGTSKIGSDLLKS
ncbi:MAG: hypothetical protein SGJ02_06620 [bacterium]|nr:hypothetical protein [bacterium]